MCITEFAVQILAQHCKSTIIQQLKKKEVMESISDLV